jgi:hypothetical protein
MTQNKMVLPRRRSRRIQERKRQLAEIGKKRRPEFV